MEKIDLFNIKKGQLQDCIKKSLIIFQDLSSRLSVNLNFKKSLQNMSEANINHPPFSGLVLTDNNN